MNDLKRKCPKCGEEIPYSTKYTKIYAEKRNTNCLSCANSGENNAMYGKSYYDIWFKKYGKKEADKKWKEKSKKMSESHKGKKREPFTDEWKKNIGESVSGERNGMHGKFGENNPNFGSKRSDETKKKMRLSAIKRREKQYGHCYPNHNPKSISRLKEEAKKYNITDLQHAETPGGEFQVCGYFVDGFSPSKNIVIEYYEKAHKYKKERDKRRKREIIKELGCKFIEIGE